jgi:hypothetical protein
MICPKIFIYTVERNILNGYLKDNNRVKKETSCSYVIRMCAWWGMTGGNFDICSGPGQSGLTVFAHSAEQSKENLCHFPTIFPMR